VQQGSFPRWLVLTGLLLGGGHAHAVLDRATYVSLGASVLQIEAPRERGGYALGSGVVVGPEQVVTNCHVTREARAISVLQGGRRWRVSEQAADIEHDLCLLHVPGVPAPAVMMRRAAELQLGQEVTALGYTGGIGIQNSDGEVVALHRLDGAPVVQSSNWFNSGASGGGLFDGSGHLVGILTFRLRGATAQYYAAPSEWVAALVERASNGAYRPVAPLDTGTLPYWQQSTALQPRFLRADQLLRQERFNELAALAKEWLHEDAADAEPWYLLGTARERLAQWQPARHALECALQIEPRLHAARAQLAPVYERLGLPEAAESARAGLVPVSAGAATTAWPCLAEFI
jgi:serine protease Do